MIPSLTGPSLIHCTAEDIKNTVLKEYTQALREGKTSIWPTGKSFVTSSNSSLANTDQIDSIDRPEDQRIMTVYLNIHVPPGVQTLQTSYGTESYYIVFSSNQPEETVHNEHNDGYATSDYAPSTDSSQPGWS